MIRMRFVLAPVLVVSIAFGAAMAACGGKSRAIDCSDDEGHGPDGDTVECRDGIAALRAQRKRSDRICVLALVAGTLVLTVTFLVLTATGRR
jgi:hypothetical protein